MKIITRNLSFVLSTVLLTAISFSSCKKSSSNDGTTTPAASEYGIFVRAGSPSGDYIIPVSSLTSGTAMLSGNGAEVTSVLSYSGFAKNGYYYGLRDSKLSKFKLQNNQLVSVAAVPFSFVSSMGSPIWVDDNTMLILGSGTANGTVKLLYAIVNATGESLSLTKTGEVTLTTLPAGYSAFTMGNYQLRNGKLYVEYSFDNGWSVATPSGSYLSTMDYPAFTNITTDRDTRSTAPGGTLGYQPSAFTGESGDIYVMNMPGVRMGNYPTLPTIISRIKSGTTTFDKDYVFDISATAGQHAYGMWYLGNGKALIKTERKSLISTWEDYSKYVFDYYIVDVNTKTAKHLDIPLHAGALLGNVVIENGKAYIANQSETAGNYVWEYDPTADKLTQGLKVQDGLQFVLRLDKIK